MKARILLVEDDPRIVSFLHRGLEGEGYEVAVAANGWEALERAKSDYPAVILLDRKLPGMSGLEVCAALRRDGNRAMILMLTAMDALQDKIDGLRSGADDYLTKPFSLGEVMARIEALLRRHAPADLPSVLEVGDLRLDEEQRTVFRGDRQIELTAKEYELLRYLMLNAGKALSREQLMSKVWRINFDPGTNVVDVYVRYLRRKIDEGEEAALIKTVRGFGYKLDA